jgi:hypothetical protein
MTEPRDDQDVNSSNEADSHQEGNDPPFNDWGSSELFTRSYDDPNEKRKSS